MQDSLWEKKIDKIQMFSNTWKLEDFTSKPIVWKFERKSSKQQKNNTRWDLYKEIKMYLHGKYENFYD